MIELALSILRWSHVAACFAAMAAFFPIVFTRKGGTVHRAWGKVFTIAYAAACLSSLGIFRHHKFWFPHWLAVGGLAVVAVGFLSARYKPRGWRYIHLTAMLLSAYNLFGGAVNEAFLRIKPLHAMVGDDFFASPIVGAVHGLVMMLFIILTVVYIVVTAVQSPRRFRRATAEESL